MSTAPMDFLARLKQARSSNPTVKHRLLADYSAAGNTLHIFIEGHDDSTFYANHIKAVVPSAYRVFYYRCGNKKGVYDALANANNDRYDLRRLWFFVDSDKALILNEPWPKADCVYVTDYYSIENYLVSEEALMRFLQDIVHLELSHEIEEIVRGHFRRQLQQFSADAVLITAWEIAIRAAGQQPIVNNIRFEEFWNLDSNAELRRIRSDTGGARVAKLDAVTRAVTPAASWRTIRSEVRRLRGLFSPKQCIRGKIELAFFVRFLNGLLPIVEQSRPAQAKRAVVRTQVHDENAVEVLAPRLPPPESLIAFLRDRANGLP